jgi:hypothetical protein
MVDLIFDLQFIHYPAVYKKMFPAVYKKMFPATYMVTISCSQSPKDVDELKEEVQEARRVKMLHCPSKVNRNAYCTTLLFKLQVVFFHIWHISLIACGFYKVPNIFQVSEYVSRQWISKMRFKFYEINLLKNPQILFTF